MKSKKPDLQLQIDSLKDAFLQHVSERRERRVYHKIWNMGTLDDSNNEITLKLERTPDGNHINLIIKAEVEKE